VRRGPGGHAGEHEHGQRGGAFAPLEVGEEEHVAGRGQKAHPQGDHQEDRAHAHQGNQDEAGREGAQHTPQRGEHPHRACGKAHVSVARQEAHQPDRKRRDRGHQAAGHGEQEQRGDHGPPEDARAFERPLQGGLDQRHGRGEQGGQAHQVREHHVIRSAVGQIPAQVVAAADAHQDDADQSGPGVKAVAEPGGKDAVARQFHDHHRGARQEGRQDRIETAGRVGPSDGGRSGGCRGRFAFPAPLPGFALAHLGCSESGCSGAWEPWREPPFRRVARRLPARFAIGSSIPQSTEACRECRLSGRQEPSPVSWTRADGRHARERSSGEPTAPSCCGRWLPRP